jgi:hypothetical protein
MANHELTRRKFLGRSAAVELGHQAARTLHLANLAYHKKTRAVLDEDGLSVRV